MFFGLASFEVVVLAADHWFGSLVPNAFLLGICKLETCSDGPCFGYKVALVNGMVLSYPKAKG